MFKQTCHLPPVITKQKSRKYEKVMCHVQRDMLLTRYNYKQKSMGYEKVMCHDDDVQIDMLLTCCNYKTKEHGI
jgi:hypothetical protein